METHISYKIEAKSNLIRQVVLFAFFLGASNGIAQERTDTLSLEQERKKALERFNVTKVPDLDAVREIAAQLFAQPIKQQDSGQLKKLAEEANRSANLIDYIYDEYMDYYRENYKYDFVQAKVAEPAKDYERVFNEFLSIRNQAYFNLGLLAKDDGKTMEAFLYFKDAYRLSLFECGTKQPAKNCIRWKAEQELQKLLGLTEINAYVTWK